PPRNAAATALRQPSETVFRTAPPPDRQHSLPEKTESNPESADRSLRFPYRAGRLYLYIFIPEHSNNLNI
ncbi:hypothetical protein, partial [Alistipes finegoldii]|uniref:hypothetical protein n=1 Tax=Alistipes finegoldii TaxID=214856 RepID=UPI00256EDC45